VKERKKERKHFEDLGVDCRILKTTIKKQNGRVWD
jgi:hypothetical protein